MEMIWMEDGIDERERGRGRDAKKKRERRATADCEETEGLSERGVQCECNTFP